MRRPFKKPENSPASLEPDCHTTIAVLPILPVGLDPAIGSPSKAVCKGGPLAEEADLAPLV